VATAADGNDLSGPSATLVAGGGGNNKDGKQGGTLMDKG
jgi:hypothetical protein